MMDIDYDQPRVSTQTTRVMLAHVGIVIVAIMLLVIATGFVARIDGLTVALTDMRQACLMEKAK